MSDTYTRRWIVFVVVISALLVGVVLWRHREKTESISGPSVHFDGATFSLEVADTPLLQERGLGFRDSLCETCAMLFVFPRADRYAFWMKDMRFPIDIVWIRDGRVVHIESNVDFRDQERVYRPAEPADRVVEVNAGMCGRSGIQKGSEVSFTP